MYNTDLLDNYLEFTRLTAKYPPEQAIEYTVLGLVSEAGEVAGKLKKFIRDGTEFEDLQKDMAKELGDCLWYIFRCADEFGLEPASLFTGNVQKLQKRVYNDTISGSGDNR